MPVGGARYRASVTRGRAPRVHCASALTPHLISPTVEPLTPPGDALRHETGPVDEVVELPFHLYWSDDNNRFDLSKRARLRSMYQIVLTEGTADDVRTYINRALLIDVSTVSSSRSDRFVTSATSLATNCSRSSPALRQRLHRCRSAASTFHQVRTLRDCRIKGPGLQHRCPCRRLRRPPNLRPRRRVPNAQRRRLSRTRRSVRRVAARNSQAIAAVHRYRDVQRIGHVPRVHEAVNRMGSRVPIRS